MSAVPKPEPRACFIPSREKCKESKKFYKVEKRGLGTGLGTETRTNGECDERARFAEVDAGCLGEGLPGVD